MNIELFDKAVDFIASRADHQLDLGDWQRSTIRVGRVAKTSEEVHCGTIACAAGWLALDHEFEALGLFPSNNGSPIFNGLYGYSAMAAVFGMPREVASNLFYFRTYADSDLFGNEAARQMTDRQLWLSRARVVRANYLADQAAKDNTNKFRLRPVEVHAFTFEEMLAEGVKTATSLVNGVPWSFTFRGYAVTHESDDCYLIQLENGSRDMTEENILVIDKSGAYVFDKDIFEATYEHV